MNKVKFVENWISEHPYVEVKEIFSNMSYRYTNGDNDISEKIYFCQLKYIYSQYVKEFIVDRFERKLRLIDLRSQYFRYWVGYFNGGERDGFKNIETFHIIKMMVYGKEDLV